MTQSRAESYTSTNLEDWLARHTVPRQNLLNLNYNQFHWVERDFWETKYKEDPSYRTYLPEFMHNPNSYLHKHPEIQYFDVGRQANFWNPDNDMKELGANQTLLYMGLGNNYLSTEHMKDLATNKTVLGLSLPYNSINGAYLGQMKQLTYLNLAATPLEDKYGAEIVRNCTNLRTIDLSGTSLGKETIKALKESKSLTSINVDLCEVGCGDWFKLRSVAKENAKRAKLSENKSTMFAPRTTQAPATDNNYQPATARI